MFVEKGTAGHPGLSRNWSYETLTKKGVSDWLIPVVPVQGMESIVWKIVSHGDVPDVFLDVGNLPGIVVHLRISSKACELLFSRRHWDNSRVAVVISLYYYWTCLHTGNVHKYWINYYFCPDNVSLFVLNPEGCRFRSTSGLSGKKLLCPFCFSWKAIGVEGNGWASTMHVLFLKNR